MKIYRVLLILIVLITSCKSSKTIVVNSVVAKPMSVNNVTKKHVETGFDKNTLDAKLKVSFEDNYNKQNLTVKLRIDKDKIIWLNATYAGVLVARAKITPNSVSYYEKLNKTYFSGNFELLQNILGTEVNFTQLQNLLLGQTIFDLNDQKYSYELNNNAHLLLPEKQNVLFDVLFWINPIHFKLDKQELKGENQLLKVDYSNYAIIEGEVFPKNIEIRAKEKEKFTNIDIEYRSVIFNKSISTPFTIPKGYKQVVF
jgi:hypothetical protein